MELLNIVFQEIQSFWEWIQIHIYMQVMDYLILERVKSVLDQKIPLMDHHLELELIFKFQKILL